MLTAYCLGIAFIYLHYKNKMLAVPHENTLDIVWVKTHVKAS